MPWGNYMPRLDRGALAAAQLSNAARGYDVDGNRRVLSGKRNGECL